MMIRVELANLLTKHLPDARNGHEHSRRIHAELVGNFLRGELVEIGEFVA